MLKYKRKKISKHTITYLNFKSLSNHYRLGVCSVEGRMNDEL
jgi:hypothetical protein